MTTELVHYGTPVSHIEAARAFNLGLSLNFVAVRKNPDRVVVTHLPGSAQHILHPIAPEQLDPATNRLHKGTFYIVS